MKMNIKFGGSGDIPTKKLEDAIELVIRARTLHGSITIDSNFIICLIREVIESRDKARPYVSEFTLDNDSFGDEEKEDDEEEAVELRRPVPLKRKSQSQIHKVKISSKDYWLNSWRSRAIAGIVLLALIILPIILTFA